ncbi:lipopolysaccharide biosynthesis protein [Aequorivita sinensis]|uniref:lipopolysaccharide biosynthesis protein n=1 Tax=Aequorivita TaxID=153265 RepID=UPI0031EADE60
MFLYIRMLLSLVVSLYTSRVVLNTLGVQDFGIYNLVGGIVVLFSFINSGMTAATQRFLNFEMAKNSTKAVQRVFSVSMNAHFLIIAVIILLSETIGLWFLNNRLNIPGDRMYAANIVYQFSLLSFCFSVLKVPYNASVIAYEKMSFYAWISVLEVVLKLVIVFLLVLFFYDKLILYSILVFAVSVIIFLAYRFFCRSLYESCRYQFLRDKTLLKELMSFSGWSLFGHMALIGSNQGISFILNVFLGVTINATMGIASQVNTAIYGFVSNFQIAFNPQIVKTYASGNLEEHKKLLFQASKFSYYLLLILAVPILLNTEYILTLWLIIVPDYATEFTQLIVLFSLVDALAGPFWSSINATGKIRKYQLGVALILFMNLPIAYLLLYFNYSPIYVIVAKVVINILLLLFRLIRTHSYLHFNYMNVLFQIYLRLLLISGITIGILYIIREKVFFSIQNWYDLILFSVLSLITTLTIILILGITKRERTYLINFIRNKIS